jgi:hypothetical protein
MKIWTFTTTNNDRLDVKDNLTLKLSIAKSNIKDWLNAQVKSIGKDSIDSITLVVVTGGSKPNESTSAQYSCSVNDLPNNIKFAQAALDNDDTDSVEFSIETTGGNFIGCLTTAFDVDDKHIPKKFIVQGAEYNEPNGTLIPFAVTRPNYYAACKWVVNDFNTMAKKADRPERLTLKEVMEKHGATSPDSWGTNSWVKYTIVKEK